jgi:hypothetical protein
LLGLALARLAQCRRGGRARPSVRRGTCGRLRTRGGLGRGSDSNCRRRAGDARPARGANGHQRGRWQRGCWRRQSPGLPWGPHCGWSGGRKTVLWPQKLRPWPR